MKLGWMLYDVFDLDADNHAPLTKKSGWKKIKPAISVFEAEIENGVLQVPPYGDPAVKRAVGEEMDNAS
jgi:CRISPR-associated protein Cas5d